MRLVFFPCHPMPLFLAQAFQNRSRIYEDPGMEIADLLPQVSHHCPKDVFDHVMVIFAICIPGDLQFVVSCRFFFSDNSYTSD